MLLNQSDMKLRFPFGCLLIALGLSMEVVLAVGRPRSERKQTAATAKATGKAGAAAAARSPEITKPEAKRRAATQQRHPDPTNGNEHAQESKSSAKSPWRVRPTAKFQPESSANGDQSAGNAKTIPGPKP
jgi:hypothetical protein